MGGFKRPRQKLFDTDFEKTKRLAAQQAAFLELQRLDLFEAVTFENNVRRMLAQSEDVFRLLAEVKARKQAEE